jgi:2-methylcitrate dehydratase PrpD
MERPIEGYARCLARFTHQLRFEDIPSEALHRAKLCVLDTLGIILGATSFDESRRLISYVRTSSRKRQATVLGFNFKTSFQEAAFASGGLVELLELQDGGWRGNHPSSVIIPVAFALGEALKSSGKEFLTAIVAGYDIANRICGSVHPSHQMRGFTPTSTGGTFGAAATAGKMLGFDENLHLNSLGIAGFFLPMSLNGTLWNGCSIKLVHGGQAAKVGIESALLAKRGFTGWDDILGGPNPDDLGFCNVTADNPDLAQLTDGLGKKFTIQRGYFKAYPCCRLTHGAIDAVMGILAQNPVEINRIKAIQVNTFSLAFNKVGQNYTTPNSSLFECQFSLPFVTASTIIHGSFGVQQISKTNMADGVVHGLATKVKVSENEHFSKSFPRIRPTEVKIIMESGKSLEHRVEYTRGDPEWPLTEDDLKLKFRTLASGNLKDTCLETIISGIMGIETLSDINELIRTIVNGRIEK